MLASKFGNGCCCRPFLIRFLNTLILGEHIDGLIKASSISALAAASSLDQENSISLLLAGSGSSLQQAAIHASTYPSISQVFVADSHEFIHDLAEPWARLTQILHQQHCFSHIITSSGSFGKNILPRAAAILDVSPVTDVIRVVNCNQFVRPIYAGNALCNVKYCGRSPCMLTIRSTSFPLNSSPSPSASSDSSSKVPIQAVDLSDLGKSFKSRCLGHRSEDSGMPDLANARIVVSGGRGLKSRENFDLIEKIARRIGGAVGATRAAVDSGFVSNDMQIGQTGKIIAPDLYIAFGVSGAIQHLAGIRDSKVIVAVNKDADAPIFQISDYGLVGDLFEIIPELLEKLPPK